MEQVEKYEFTLALLKAQTGPKKEPHSETRAVMAAGILEWHYSRDEHVASSTRKKLFLVFGNIIIIIIIITTVL